MNIQDRFPQTPDWLVDKRPDHLFIFTHIEKAAGTSFTNFLGKQYGRHLGLRYGQWATPIVSDPLPEMTLDAARNLYAFSAHAPYGIHRSFGKKSTVEVREEIAGRRIVYATILRDPAERFFSGYHYIRSASSNPRHALVSTLTFEEFLNLELNAKANRRSLNLMCSMLTGRLESTFEEARAALENDYAFVAPVSGSLALIEALSSLLGWPKDVTYERRNTTSEKPQEDFEAIQKARDLGLFEEDQKLYDHVATKGLLIGDGAR